MPTTDTNLVPDIHALESLRDELLAIQPRDLLSINVDVAASALLILGVTPEIRRYRAELVLRLGEPTASVVDRLELVACAALQAQAALRTVEAGADLPSLSAEVLQIREALLSETRALIARRVLPTGVIAELHGIRGFKNKCLDVLQLVSLLDTRWDVVGPHTGITRKYLRDAEAAANALATAVGVRNQASRSPAAEMRLRAYTLMARTYEETRRLITFLRWYDGDADRIAPALQKGRPKNRPRKPTTEPSAEPTDGPTPLVVSPDLPGADPFPGA